MARLAPKNKFYAEETKIALSRVVNVFPWEVEKARNDFEFFCKHVTRNAPTQIILQKHHKVWLSLIFTEVSNDYLLRIAGENINILSPRGSSKSTVIRLLVAWLIGYHIINKRLLKVFYISANREIAQAGSETIQTIIESEEYQEIFPEAIKGDKWSSHKWRIDTNHANIQIVGDSYYTLSAAGILGTIVSFRSHLVIYDDLIKSSEDIQNPAVREKISKNHHEVVAPILFEGGRIISIGTRYRGDDCHAKTFIQEKGWKVIEQEALIENPITGELESYWEEMWSTEFLKQKMKDDPLSFSYQYQNKIVQLDSIGIDEKFIIYEVPPKKFDKYGVGIDLAVSEKTQACYTAIVLVGLVDDKYYILDMRRGKWRGNIEKLDRILELYDEWAELDKAFRVYGEAVAYQGSLQGDFKNYVHLDQKEYGITCSGITLKGDKVTHFTSLTGLFGNKRIRFNPHKDLSPLVLELVGFQTTAEYTDCLDALCLAIHGIGFRGSVQI